MDIAKTAEATTTVLTVADGSAYPTGPVPHRCWHDMHGFDGAPVPVAVMRSHGKKLPRGSYDVTGYFCSPSCAMAYARRGRTLANVDMTREMLRSAYGQKCVRVADPYETLTAFGGKVTIEEFRARNAADVPVKMLEPRLVIYNPSVSQDVKFKKISDNTRALSAASSGRSIFDPPVHMPSSSSSPMPAGGLAPGVPLMSRGVHVVSPAARVPASASNKVSVTSWLKPSPTIRKATPAPAKDTQLWP